jgi:hypothetical protein
LLRNNLRLQLPLTISRVVDDPEGKWASALGSVTVVEAQPFYDSIKTNIITAVQFNISAIDLRPFGFPFGITSNASSSHPISVRRLSVFHQYQ